MTHQKNTTMFQARRKDNGIIVEAEELKVITNVGEIEFYCVSPECGIDLIPCSYGVNNKKRPFFKKYHNKEHSEDCSYSTYLKFQKIGKKRKLTEIEFEKLKYPSKLVVVKKNTLETDTSTKKDLPIDKSKSTRRVNNGEFEEVAESNRRVSSISQIVDFYLNYPYNRDVDLDLLGTEAPYKYQFRRIYGKNKGNYTDNKIFYGIINFSDPDSIIHEKNLTKIKLHECEKWEKNPRSLFNTKIRVNPYWVEIDHEQVSRYKLNSILKSRETVSNQSKNDYLKKIKKSKVNAFIFFLGTAPLKEKPYVFKAVGSFVTCRYTEVLHKKEPRKN